MGEKFREFKLLQGGEEKGNATLLAYANKKIEDLDNRRKILSKAIADLSVETLSSQQIELLSGYLDDWENNQL